MSMVAKSGREDEKQVEEGTKRYLCQRLVAGLQRGRPGPLVEGILVTTWLKIAAHDR